MDAQIFDVPTTQPSLLPLITPRLVKGEPIAPTIEDNARTLANEATRLNPEFRSLDEETRALKLMQLAEQYDFELTPETLGLALELSSQQILPGFEAEL